MVNSRRGLPFVFLLSFISQGIQAAPQKHSCHFSPDPESSSHSSDGLTASTPVSITTTTVVPVGNSTTFASPITVTNAASTSTDTVQMTSGALTTQASITRPSANPLTITPEVILVYPNNTYTLPSSISLSIPLSFLTSTTPMTTPAAFNSPPPTPSPTPSNTTSSSTFTTPDIDAMQTAYYISVCGWPEHLDDAICLGNNTMMCCRADNEHCQGTLMDGGLSCQGIESGDWATSWSRSTVTLGESETDSATTSTNPSVSITAIPNTTVLAVTSGIIDPVTSTADLNTSTAGDGARGGATTPTNTDTSPSTIADPTPSISIDAIDTATAWAEPTDDTTATSGSSTPTNVNINSNSNSVPSTSTPTASTPTASSSAAATILRVIPIDDTSQSSR